MKWIALAILASFVALTPLGAAEYYEGKPECPPDMMCTTSVEEESPDADKTTSNTTDKPTYSGECGAEVCAYDDPNAPVDDGSTCMDGAQEGEECRDDVQYLDPRTGDGREPLPHERSTEADPIKAPAEDAAKQAPLVAGATLLAALAAAGLVMGRRR